MAARDKVDEASVHAEHDDHLKENIQTLQDAQGASIAEHEMTLKEALRVNWKAAMWSAIISLTIVMEGYDLRSVILVAQIATESRF